MRDYPIWSPRLWLGMDLHTWYGLVYTKALKISKNRLGLVVVTTLVSAVQTAVASITLRWEKSIGLNNKVILDSQAPIFIIGYWRSGTTLLHELLSCYCQLKAPTTYQCFCPNHFLITEKVVTSMFSWVLPVRRGFDDVRLHWASPQEDEFALLMMGAPSPYRRIAFPSVGHQLESLEIRGLPKEQQDKWYKALSTFVKRLMLIDERRLVLKNPCHTARISSILEIFPGAKFIFISRNPGQMIPSSMKMWKYLDYYHGLESSASVDYKSYALELFKRVDDAYVVDKKLLTKNNLVEIRYEDLIEDPVGILELTTKCLGLEGLTKDKHRLNTTISQIKTYSQQKYLIPSEDMMSIAEITSEYCKRYNYSVKKER